MFFIGKIFGLAVRGAMFGANLGYAAVKNSSTKTKVILGGASCIAMGAFMHYQEQNQAIPAIDPPRNVTIDSGPVPDVKDRVVVRPDVNGNITIPGELIAKLYLETIFDRNITGYNTIVEQKLAAQENGVNVLTGQAREDLLAQQKMINEWAAQTRPILQDAITKFENIMMDSTAHQAIAEIQRRQIEASREGHPNRDDDFHEGMVSPPSVLELRQRGDMFVAQYPEYKATAEQARALEKLLGLPEGAATDTDIITVLTTLAPAWECGINTYSRYRKELIQEAAKFIVVPLQQQGSLEQKLPNGMQIKFG
jgi:hypothetical protein